MSVVKRKTEVRSGHDRFGLERFKLCLHTVSFPYLRCLRGYSVYEVLEFS